MAALETRKRAANRALRFAAGLALLVWLSPAAVLARQVVDGCGKTVELPDSIKRVVTAGGTPSLNAFVSALGKGATIVNGLPMGLHGAQWKYQKIFLPALENAPVASSMGPDWTPNLEVLQELAGDVVLVDSATTADNLTKRGFPAYCLDWRGPQAVGQTIDKLAEVLDAKDRALALHKAFKANLDRVRQATANIPADKRLKAIYIRADGLMIPMVSTARFLIEAAGGVYAAPADLSLEHPRISPEQLLAWNPDVLLVFNRKEVDNVLADPRFAGLSAVKRRAVVAVPFGLHGFTHFTPEQILAVLWMGKTLYPERFADLDLIAEARAFYADFFGISLSDDQIKDILRLP